MGLVAYSDSEDGSDDEARASAPAAPPALHPAVEQPPAKRAKKSINLQQLLSRNDAAIPFEQASKLPDDFFEQPKIEEDAGEAATAAPSRGWAALSSMLPPPKNAPKAKASSSSFYQNAKALRKPEAGASGAAAGASSSSAATPHAQAPLVGGVEDEDAADVGGCCFGAACSSAGGGGVAYSVGAGASLAPKLMTSMYEESAGPAAQAGADSSVTAAYPDAAAGGAGGGYLYSAPVGPSAPPGGAGLTYGMDEVSEDKMVSVSLDQMRRNTGAVRDYSLEAPKEEVKIAAHVWNRTTGAVESQYKASSTSKRKHQINSLAAEAAAKAPQLAMAKSSGYKSKAETAAKYGW